VALEATARLVTRRDWRLDASDYEIEVHSFVSHTKKGTRRTSRGGCPDVDNVIKLVGDALQGVAYEDDDQVTRVVGETHHGAENERLDIIVRMVVPERGSE
jgi:Holliday junction resolvase RusA-like endonuclease